MLALRVVYCTSVLIAISSFIPFQKKQVHKAAHAAAASFPAAVRLTKTSASDTEPCWTADGKIIYVSNKTGGSDIWEMDAGGANAKPFPGRLNSEDWSPAYAPDGKIVYIRSMVSNDVAIMDADGSNRHVLFDYSTDEKCPAVSKDGKIAFSSDKADQGRVYDIYVMDEDGSNVVQLTNDQGSNLNPSFSPDGTKIAFSSNRDSEYDEIYIMDVDGKNVKRLTNNSSSDYDPTWGPDGRIAFSSNRDGEFAELYVMNTDGTHQKRLTNNKVNDYGPAFGPNGKLAFYSRRDEGAGHQEDVYVMTVPK